MKKLVAFIVFPIVAIIILAIVGTMFLGIWLYIPFIEMYYDSIKGEWKFKNLLSK